MMWLIYVAHLLLLPPLLVGVLRKLKARLQNRIGPSVLQPFWDVAKLLGKGETTSQTTTWVFRAAPALSLAAMVAAALMVPWLGLPAPVPGDLILFIYLLALGKFISSLAALDAGSAFGALGASREATVSVMTEPAMLLALAALAADSGSSSLAIMLAPSPTVHLIPFVLIALWMATSAEMARMPIDDPTTHLELTMIHEALILENSGRNLALVEIGVGLKLTLLLGLLAQVALRPGLALPPVQAWFCSLALIFGGAAGLAVAESTLVKLRWRALPNMMSFAVVAGLLACLLLATKG